MIVSALKGINKMYDEIMFRHLNFQAEQLHKQEVILLEMRDNLLAMNNRINYLERILSLEGVKIE